LDSINVAHQYLEASAFCHHDLITPNLLSVQATALSSATSRAMAKVLVACTVTFPFRLEVERPKNWSQAPVESRMGAVAWGLWPALRFPSPLIEPDVPISGIRLSDWLHRKARDAALSGKRSRRMSLSSPYTTS
jgi:hypothetical protein